jgi:hypothetical protein
MRTSEANYRCLLLLLLLTGGERSEFEEHDIGVLELILAERPDGHAPIRGDGQEAHVFPVLVVLPCHLSHDMPLVTPPSSNNASRFTD